MFFPGVRSMARPRNAALVFLGVYCGVLTAFTALHGSLKASDLAVRQRRAEAPAPPGGPEANILVRNYQLPRDAAVAYPRRIDPAQFGEVEEVFHVLSHTHWDREWYLSLEQSRGALVALMDRVFDMLSNESANFKHFHLDGQFLLLEDYLEVRPSKTQQAIQFNRQGRISLGPFYSQPDFYLASGEALVRNLMYGMSLSSEFGGTSTVGYVPDSFGFMGQLPQLLLGFDIHSFATTRFLHKVGDQIGFERPRATEGNWVGSDGSKVLYVYFGNHYCHAMKIFHGAMQNTQLRTVPNMTDFVQNIIPKIRADMKEAGSASKHKLVFYGCDHYMTDPDAGKLMATLDTMGNQSYRVVQTNLDDYVTMLRDDLNQTKVSVPTIEGEVREEVDHLINSASTKMSLKQKNFVVQSLLEKWAEPMEAYKWAMIGSPYSADTLWFAWKPVLQSHAHDSICATSASPAIHDIMNRMSRAEQSTYRLIADNVASLAPVLSSRLGGIESSPHRRLIFVNPTNTPRAQWVLINFIPASSTVDGICGIKNLLGDDDSSIEPIVFLSTSRRRETYVLPDTLFREKRSKPFLAVLALARLPPNGIGHFQLVSRGCQKSEQVESLKTSFSTAKPPILENSFIKVTVDALDGSCSILEKATNHSWKRVNQITSSKGRGSSYLHHHTLLATPITEPAIKWFKQSRAFVACQIQGTMQTNSTVSITYVLYDNSRTIEIKTVIDNRKKNHVVVARFPGLHAKANSKDFRLDVDGNFEYINRNSFIGRYAHQNRFTSMFSSGGSLTVSNRGLPEYFVDEAHDYEMSLIRGVSKIADWVDAPLIDDALQELQVMSFEYAVTVAGCRVIDPRCGVDIEARNFVDPIGVLSGWEENSFRPERFIDLDSTATNSIASLNEGQLGSYPPRVLNGSLTNLHSTQQLFKIEPSKVILSSVKKAESQDALVLRMYNPINVPLQVFFGPGLLKFREIKFSQMNEKPLQVQTDMQSDEHGIVSFPMKGKKIVTVLVFLQ